MDGLFFFRIEWVVRSHWSAFTLQSRLPTPAVEYLHGCPTFGLGDRACPRYGIAALRAAGEPVRAAAIAIRAAEDDLHPGPTLGAPAAAYRRAKEPGFAETSFRAASAAAIASANRARPLRPWWPSGYFSAAPHHPSRRLRQQHQQGREGGHHPSGERRQNPSQRGTG